MWWTDNVLLSPFYRWKINPEKQKKFCKDTVIVYDGMRTFSCQIILPLRAGSTIFQGKPLKRLALENGIWHIPIESLKSWLCHSLADQHWRNHRNSQGQIPYPQNKDLVLFFFFFFFDVAHFFFLIFIEFVKIFLLFYILIFWAAYEILAPVPGIEPAPPALEDKVATPGPPGKSE